MYNSSTMNTSARDLSKREKIFRNKSLLELDQLLKALENIQLAQPLMFVDDTTGEDRGVYQPDQVDGEHSPDNRTKTATSHFSEINLLNASKSNNPITSLKPPPEPTFEHHYLIPTVSSSLPIYLQGETERIRNSFRSHSCWSIKKLPNVLDTGEVQRAKRQHVVENLVTTSSNVFKPASLLKARDFQHTEYIGTDFDKMKNLNKINVEEEKIRIDSYSRKSFVVSSRVRAKFEDVFNDGAFFDAYMGPGGGGTSEAALLRKKKEVEALRGGTLIHDKYLSKTGRSDEDIAQVRRWIERLYATLQQDWTQTSFRVRYTQSQEILVQFALPAAPNEKDSKQGAPPPAAPPVYLAALHKYMQHMSSHGVAAECGLIKRGDRWQVIERDEVATANATTSSNSNSSSGRPESGLKERSSRESNSSKPLNASGAEDDGLRWYVPGESEHQESVVENAVAVDPLNCDRRDPNVYHQQPPVPQRHSSVTSTLTKKSKVSFSASAPDIMGDLNDGLNVKNNDTLDNSLEAEEAQAAFLSGQAYTLSLRAIPSSTIPSPTHQTTASHDFAVEGNHDEENGWEAKETSLQVNNDSAETENTETEGRNRVAQKHSAFEFSSPDAHGQLEEQEQLSDEKGGARNQKEGVNRSGTYVDYLTYAFYTPFVTFRTAQTHRVYAQQQRHRTRAAAVEQKQQKQQLLRRIDEQIRQEKDQQYYHSQQQLLSQQQLQQRAHLQGIFGAPSTTASTQNSHNGHSAPHSSGFAGGLRGHPNDRHQLLPPLGQR